MRTWFRPSEAVQRQLEPSRARHQPITDLDLEVITSMTSESPLDATKHLIWVAGTDNFKLKDLAHDQLLGVEGWQFAIEGMLWDVHLARWECDSETQLRHPTTPVLGNGEDLSDYLSDLNEVYKAEASIFSSLTELASKGSNDAALLAAPYLFDRSDLLPVPGGGFSIEGTIYEAHRVFAAIRRTRVPSINLGRERYKAAWRRWWLEHAYEFLAQPPASAQATVDEVLNLTKAAMRAHLNTTFTPLPQPRPPEWLEFDINGHATPESLKRMQEMFAADTTKPSASSNEPLTRPTDTPTLPAAPAASQSYWVTLFLVLVAAGGAAAAVFYFWRKDRKSRN